MFSFSYEEARTRFLAAADQAGYRQLRFRVPHEDSSELFLDFALLRRNPKKVLLHISGVHGVEGFAGSAVQLALLQHAPSEEGPTILFAHGVNPYGFNFYRRANGQNVDLNRNYRHGPAKPNPGYAQFAPFLNPRTPADFRFGKWQALWRAFRMGRAAAGQAIASGQVDFPRGLFYMGTRVQREIQLVQEILKSHCAEAEEMLAIDLHTGLGNFAQEQFFTEDAKPEEIYGRAATPQSAYVNQGRFEDAIRDALPKTKIRYAVQEFGTRKPMAVLEALRAETLEWHQRPAGHPRPESVVRSMMETFCPSEPAWREEILRVGTERWRQAEKFLSASGA